MQRAWSRAHALLAQAQGPVGALVGAAATGGVAVAVTGALLRPQARIGGHWPVAPPSCGRVWGWVAAPGWSVKICTGLPGWQVSLGMVKVPGIPVMPRAEGRFAEFRAQPAQRLYAAIHHHDLAAGQAGLDLPGDPPGPRRVRTYDQHPAGGPTAWSGSRAPGIGLWLRSARSRASTRGQVAAPSRVARVWASTRVSAAANRPAARRPRPARRVGMQQVSCENPRVWDEPVQGRHGLV